MSTFPAGPQKPVTIQEVNGWLSYARVQRAQWHLQVASLSLSDERQGVFTAMSALLLEAFEKVRVLSEALQERSEAAWDQIGFPGE